MSDFGGKLRLARERRGVSLRQIADSTKISLAALEALERNDVSKLPGGIFSKAFVRSYAAEVGLNPDETAREFLERFQGDPAASSVAAGGTPDEEGFERRQRTAAVVVTLAAISIPLIAVVLYFTLRSRGTDRGVPVTDGAPVAVSAPAQAPVVASAPLPASSSPGVAAAAKAMTFELRATGECWVRLTADGRPVLSRLMLPGEKEVREVTELAVIQVGNAGAFAFSVDGRPGKALGAPGEVRTARITKATLAGFLQ
jgi:cytoskeletal protein RodZ